MKKTFILVFLSCLFLVGFAQPVSTFFKEEVKPLMRENEFDNALKKLDKFYVKNPKADSVLVLKAGILAYLGKQKESEDAYNQLIKKNNAFQTGQTISMIGMIAYLFNDDFGDKVKENQSVVKYYLKKAETEYPNDYMSYFVQAGMYEEEKDFENCIKYAKKAYELNPVLYEESGVYLAQTYRNAGQKENGYKELENILKIVKNTDGKMRALNKRFYWAQLDKNWELARVSINALIASNNGSTLSYLMDKIKLFYKMNQKDSVKQMLEEIRTYDEITFQNDAFLTTLYETLGYESINLGKTSSLQYLVSMEGRGKYDFIVSNIAPNVKDNQLISTAFDWAMPHQTGAKGRITLNNLKNASKIVNYFSAEEPNVSYDKETTVWLTQEMLEKLRNEEEVEIALDDETDKLYSPQYGTYTLTIDGVATEVPVMLIDTERGNHFTVLDDPKNPLILEMKVAFAIEIQEIKTK